MADVLYYPNLRSAGEQPTSTGTTVADDQLVDHACLDVYARNDSNNPLYITGSFSAASENILGQDIHDASAANIDDNAGAYIAFGNGVTIPASTKRVQLSSTLGEPFEVAFAANLGAAAASAKKIYCVQGGAPGIIPFVPGTDNLAFIRSLSANTITENYVTLNFIG